MAKGGGQKRKQNYFQVLIFVSHSFTIQSNILWLVRMY